MARTVATGTMQRRGLDLRAAVRGKNRVARLLRRMLKRGISRGSGAVRMLRALPKHWRETMTEKTLEALTDEEWEMIETIRENREDDGFRLLIERKHGIWEIELQSARAPNLERGTGADFNEAWDNITETIP